MKQIFVGKMDERKTAAAVKEAKLLSKVTPAHSTNQIEPSHVLTQMHHPNIVAFFDAFAHDTSICIVMEHCDV